MQAFDQYGMFSGYLDIADTSGLFDVEHVGFTVPSVGTCVNFPSSTVHSEWTVFLHETKH